MIDMTTKGLKPCPMCGAKDPNMVIYILRWVDKYMLRCDRCGFSVKKATLTRAGAVRKWNRVKTEDGER